MRKDATARWWARSCSRISSSRRAAPSLSFSAAIWCPSWVSPLGFPEGGFPAPQGHYYCGVGAEAVFG
ncbi:hypothetical protein AB0K48_53670, partial [Nonomuraea sp. NPDC055795]